ncbi:MAG: serine/threonine-protein kinase [Acidobacteriota bacterium]
MSADSTVPGKIGKYVVTGVLGGGSMGVVYVGRDPTINRLVALKTIYVPKGLDGDKVVEFQERFLREAQAAGQLSSPAVVTIYEADDGTWGGPPFIAMEYIEGVTWKEMIKRGERMAPDRLVPQVRELAAALSQAHRAGIVHRDIKPANIITTARGGVKLMDFGVARVPTSDLTQEGQFIGTPAYMAPEQIEGKPVDGRADIFSLGCVLYEMLSGAKPFPGDEVTVVTHRILNEEPPLLEKRIQGIPKHLALIVRTMLAKDPRVRYQNADELLSDLYDYEAGRFPSAVKRRMTATPAPAEGAAQVAKRAERRRPSRKDRRRPSCSFSRCVRLLRSPLRTGLPKCLRVRAC